MRHSLRLLLRLRLPLHISRLRRRLLVPRAPPPALRKLFLSPADCRCYRSKLSTMSVSVLRTLSLRFKYSCLSLIRININKSITFSFRVRVVADHKTGTPAHTPDWD